MGISDLLNASGGKSFKFATAGATITGKIVSAEVVQKRNFDTNELEFWADGQPVQQIRVALETPERDPADPEDDGQRSVYVKGWGDQLRALRAAIKAAGAADLEPGGTFTATYVRDGELPPGKRGFPPKVYEYTYQRPTATAGILATTQEQPAPQQAQAVPPPQQGAAPAAAAQPSPEALAAFAAWQASQQNA